MSYEQISKPIDIDDISNDIGEMLIALTLQHAALTPGVAQLKDKPRVGLYISGCHDEALRMCDSARAALERGHQDEATILAQTGLTVLEKVREVVHELCPNSDPIDGKD